ncbi:unnamed protein product [Prorocentrum cordatum]|uniref:Uncharacterized protein n=1 Tax=Prorocentrum cordatum TaxID=2364126 RepID=A0ABN9V9X0_9DINO|nr:unnamed protein product [Polarella glacialis]
MSCQLEHPVPLSIHLAGSSLTAAAAASSGGGQAVWTGVHRTAAAARADSETNALTTPKQFLCRSSVTGSGSSASVSVRTLAPPRLCSTSRRNVPASPCRACNIGRSALASGGLIASASAPCSENQAPHWLEHGSPVMLC